MEKKERIVHPVDEILPLGQLFAYGMQHVLAMYAGAVAVPLILAQAMHLSVEQLIYLINADLFVCGIATLIQTLGIGNIGARIPMIQGVTFAAVSPMILIGTNHGMQGIYGAIIVAGLITFLAAPYFSKLIRFFPPVVTGTIITTIGITLMPVAVRWAGGGNPGAADFGSLDKLALAAFTMVCVVVLYRSFTGFLSNISVLLALALGTAVAYVFGYVNFDEVVQAHWIGFTTPFTFGFPVFEIGPIISMVIVMIVCMTETTGDCIAIGEIVDKKIGEKELAQCLRADGLSTLLGGIFNSFPYTAFAQNVGLIGLTRVKSRYVVAASGIILILLGLFPKMAAIIACIPSCVLGGAGIAMFSMIASSGIRTLSKVEFDGTYNMMIIGLSLGIGTITLAVPDFYKHFPEWAQIIFHSGITAGSVTAIVLNYVLNEMGKKRA